MDFAEELAAFRAAHPDVTAAEVFVVDLNARVRGKLVPIESLDKLAAGTMKLPTSTPALDLFSEDVYEAGLAVQTGDPDGRLDAVPGTLGRIGWADTPTAQVQVTIRLPDGQVAPFDARNTLARVVERTRALGLLPVLALEQEFFLLDARQPLPPVNPVTGERLSAGQVYDLDVGRAFAPALEAITTAAAALGVPTETVVTEYAFGQFEVNIDHCDDALAAADRVVALRRAVRGMARRHGYDATFMAKPFAETIGSGLHVHLSLWDDAGRNVFAGDPGAPGGVLRQAVGGCLAHMVDSTLIFAPHLNSYRRFVPSSLAPCEALWALDHRSVAVRVPETSGKGARIEHRVAGADANPYLVVAAVLAAVADGLERRTEPPDRVSGEFPPGSGPELPPEWLMAERAFSSSDFIRDWLGSEVQHVFGAVKRQERAKVLGRVTDVEHELYLRSG